MVATSTLRSSPLHLVSRHPEAREHPFVGSSRAVVQLLDKVDRIARTELPVLITGESGTGKEVLAHRIHARSDRAAGPFVAENCAAIPEGLQESEFFGHVRGAFTGADRCADGALVRADGGTIMLDEIGDMPLALQAKLLRVLEDGRVRPVGGSSARVVDVRIVSATNQDLPTCVREGEFREDLLYRIRGANVHISPLRSRPTDVGELARYFLHELNLKFRAHKDFSPGTWSRLLEHPWPGNVRELRNRVTLLYQLCDGDDIRDDMVDFVSMPRWRRPRLVTAVAPLAEIERDAIQLALAETRGDCKEAARRLGISRATVYARIKQYDLALPRA